MTWFLAFSTLGVAITVFLLFMKWAYRPTIKGVLSGIAVLGLCSFLAQK